MCEAKVFVVADAETETNWKHKVTPDCDDFKYQIDQ